MGAAEHQAMATEAEREAIEEEAQYDPKLETLNEPDCIEYCFTANPTGEHLNKARKLRREAAAHRKASRELLVAEERACAGIPELHRDYSPFFHRDNITGAEVPEEGALVVHFDKIRNTSAEQLQRLIDCHLARNAALGFENVEMAFCPLAVAKVGASVVETEAGFDIQLEPEDEEARAELVERVEQLIATPE